MYNNPRISILAWMRACSCGNPNGFFSPNCWEWVKLCLMIIFWSLIIYGSAIGTGFGYQAILDLPSINSTLYICQLPWLDSNISRSTLHMMFLCPIFGVGVSAIILVIMAIPICIIFWAYKKIKHIYEVNLEDVKVENKSYEGLNPTKI